MCLKKSGVVTKILVALIVLITVTFAVAGMLQSRIYFSYFIGIPVGILSALVVIMLMRKKRH